MATFIDELPQESHDLFLEHQHFIQELLDGHTNAEIATALARRCFQTSIRSLQRRLHSWGFQRLAGASGVRNGGTESDILAEAINHIFHHTTLNDTAIAARISTDYKLHTTVRQVKRIRLKAGWLRASSGTKKAAKRAETQQQVENAISNGPARIFGRRWLITWLRLHGFKAHQVDVSSAQRLIDPNGVTSHQPGLRKARLENYVTSGPNFLWCLDGHDKFSQYGIQIYAAVDAYSREIIWFYVGNSNRIAISVFNQYFNAVQAIGICPRFIPTDKGTETVLLADLHFSLFIEAALREQWSEQEYQSLRISDCFIYGPSTHNIRVEGLWHQQRFQCTGPWLDYLKTLQSANLHRQDLFPDQVVAVTCPINTWFSQLRSLLFSGAASKIVDNKQIAATSIRLHLHQAAPSGSRSKLNSQDLIR
jgi:hypothetical protein